MATARDAGPSFDPLAGHAKYEKVRYLNSGAFGFVLLARNKRSGRHVAIKFLPRGDRVGKASPWGLGGVWAGWTVWGRRQDGRHRTVTGGGRSAGGELCQKRARPCPAHPVASTSSAKSSTTPTLCTPTSSSSRRRALGCWEGGGVGGGGG